MSDVSWQRTLHSLVSLLSYAGALLGLAVLLPRPTGAQPAPALTVKNSSDKVVLQSFVDGGLLATDQLIGGTIPASGAGVRMVWYPKDAAFRAGEVTGSQWDDSNVGSSSVAFGFNTEASGASSTAMGEGTMASGNQSTALGRVTIASANSATALGDDTEANAERATALGSGTTASGKNSTAMNDRTTAGGEDATAMGESSTANGAQATAMGDASDAGGHAATAMGNFASATGGAATAIGDGAQAEGDSSLAAGAYAEAKHDATFVWSDGSGASDASGTVGDEFSSGTSDGQSGVTGSRTFHVKSINGARFITKGNNNLVTYIADGTAGWASTSTRTAKTNIDPINPRSVLERILSLEISTWEYKGKKGKGQGVRHIGPMAEDFHQAFDLGSSENAINSINADGVALGAIKGLAQRVERQKKRITELKAENEAIKKRQKELESRLSRLEARIEGSSAPTVAGTPILPLLSGWTGSGGGLLLGLLLGGLLGVGIIWRYRA